MQAIEKDAGIAELTRLLESAEVPETEVRVLDQAKGQGNGQYNEVTLTSDEVVVQW